MPSNAIFGIVAFFGWYAWCEQKSQGHTVVIQKKKLRVILLDSPLLWFFLFSELAFREGPRDLGCFWMVTVPRIWINISTPGPHAPDLRWWVSHRLQMCQPFRETENNMR